ncbi:CLC_0170 family protein [Rossellomorea oryzaecorticis]|uniref:CLC_0170 family protein n=1 Tax=Rossellomorea oryzaecorticis TaxID=1396505 RepID=A0ABU9K516_9BACI
MTTVIGYAESFSSYYLVIILIVIGLYLRLRYYTAYKDRNLDRDAQAAKFGGYGCLILSGVVLIAHFIIS